MSELWIRARWQGKSLMTTSMIRSVCGQDGLPVKSFVLGKLDYMVCWDTTGEVKTIEYEKQSAEIDFVSYNEIGVILNNG